MADKTETNQRGRGRPFQKGQSGNPAGRPQGSRNKATLAVQALIDGQADALVNKALELALAGDGPILKAILDRLCPPRKDAPVRLELPRVVSATDLPRVTGAILTAVAEGELTPGEAQALAGLVEGHRKALEAEEVELRLAALERAVKEGSR